MEKHFLGIPKLPLEVMGLIFESLAYAEENEEIARTTLRTCALASRTLCTLVQPLLFRSIALDLDLDDDDDDGGFQEEDEGEEDSTPDETSDVHLLLNLFRHSPHLRVHVQEISVGYRSLSSPEFPALLGLLPNVTSFVADGYDEGSSVHSHRGKHFIASVIYCKHHLLPKLTTFKLSSFWQIPDENLDLLQQLRHLEISETDLSPEKGVTGAPTSILKDLHISDRVVPQHPLSHITYGLPAVSFDGCEQGLVKWIKRHNCRPTSLRIFSPNKYAEPHERKAAYNLLEACAESVEKVEIYDLTTSHAGDSWKPNLPPGAYEHLKHYVLNIAPPLPKEKLKTSAVSTPKWLSLLLEKGPAPPLLELVELQLDTSLVESPDTDPGWQNLDHTLSSSTWLPCLKSVVWKFRSTMDSISVQDAEEMTRKGLPLAQDRGIIRFAA